MRFQISHVTLSQARRRSFRRNNTEDTLLTLSDDAAGVVAQPSYLEGYKPVSSEILLARILDSLSQDKAEDVVDVDLRGKTAIGDYMVIASGRSTRQVAAMAEKLTIRLKQEFGRLSKIEGKNTGDWILVDTGDIIVHLFRPEVRAFYQLEKMWVPLSQQAKNA